MKTSTESFVYQKLLLKQQMAARENRLMLELNELTDVKTYIGSALTTWPGIGGLASLAYRLTRKFAGSRESEGSSLRNSILKGISYIKALQLTVKALRKLYNIFKTNSSTHDK